MTQKKQPESKRWWRTPDGNIVCFVMGDAANVAFIETLASDSGWVEIAGPEIKEDLCSYSAAGKVKP